MDISDLIGPQHVALDVRVRDKADLLRELSRRAAPFVGVKADAIARILSERERLGSTGLGSGFALPHARVGEVNQLFGTFLRLGRPIKFQAIDGKPVDLVFLLLIPADARGEHIAALAAVSRRFRDSSVVERLRQTESAKAAYQLLTRRDCNARVYRAKHDSELSPHTHPQVSLAAAHAAHLALAQVSGLPRLPPPQPSVALLGCFNSRNPATREHHTHTRRRDD
jgi:PTS system nitrogen regulatory IIA component